MPAASHLDLQPPVNYVLIDDENVPNLDLSSIEGKTVHVILLLGPAKAMLPVEQMLPMMKHAASAQLIRLEKAGKNALDFALAYYLGRAVQEDPGACFNIVSKDTGYDSLIAHLEARNIRIRKHADASTMTFGAQHNGDTAAKASPAAKTMPADVLQETLKHLRKREGKNPKTRSKLESDLKAHLGQIAAGGQIKELIQQLVKGKYVRFDDKGKAKYDI